MPDPHVLLVVLAASYALYAAIGWRASLGRLAALDGAPLALRADDLVASILHAAACAFGLGVALWGVLGG